MCNLAEGVVVPMPTLPVAVTLKYGDKLSLVTWNISAVVLVANFAMTAPGRS